MTKDTYDERVAAQLAAREETQPFGLSEILDQAFAGWVPADQTLERLIDRWEQKR